MDRNIDLSKYIGLNQFGSAYQVMLENDAHAPDSVDCMLLKNMIRICEETAGYIYNEHTPTKTEYQKGSRPDLESYVNDAIAGCKGIEDQIEGIALFCSRLSLKVKDQPIDDMLFGGTEEEIIQRGSDLCVDVSRVGSAMCQVAGFPSRLVYLADTDQAYSGHAIIEVYRENKWGAVDTSTSVIYRHNDGKIATTWELMNSPSLIELNRDRSNGFYTTVGQFRSATVSNYFIWDWKQYNYKVSKINDYYNSILRMSESGWQGGLRWIFGEEESNNI